MYSVYELRFDISFEKKGFLIRRESRAWSRVVSLLSLARARERDVTVVSAVRVSRDSHVARVERHRIFVTMIIDIEL